MHLTWKYTIGEDLVMLSKMLWSLYGLWKTFRLPVYDKNSVHTTDETELICKLDNA